MAPGPPGNMESPSAGTGAQSLVSELDPHITTKSLNAAAETWHSQINKQIKINISVLCSWENRLGVTHGLQVRVDFSTLREASLFRRTVDPVTGRL